MKMFSVLLPTLFCIHSSFTLSHSQSLSNETDYFSLLEFKDGVTNPDHVLVNNWTSSTSFCSWIGVTCSRRRQRVTSLILADMGLEGEISSSIGNLSFLITLDLSNNTFYGSFPFEHCRFPRLTTLNLHRNKLSGSIYPSVGNFTRLQQLYLHVNNIGGKIPGEIGNLTHLVLLNLRNNRLTGSIPPAIFDLPSLRRISVANNSLSGRVLLGENSLMKNSGLEAIELGYNQLTGEIPSNLCRFRELLSFGISFNNITGKLPENIDCLSKLEQLLMRRNGISGNVPPSLGNISTLQSLNCRDNMIGGSIPPELGKLINLEGLNLEGNQLVGEIPPEIFNSSSLISIAFTTNNLSGPIPATAGLHLPNLEGIFLANNKLQGEIPLSVTNATKLQVLEVSYNMFVGSVPPNLGNLKKLVLLNLAYNQLRNEPGNQQLGFLDSLVECRMLRNLIVLNNPLGGSLPGSIQNLSTTIERFYMDNSQISGHIPPGIGNLSSLIALRLNGNSLSGTIPIEMGKLHNLQILYLYGNRLQEGIPAELCNLVNLGEMSISRNNLSGTIPSCLRDFTRLQVLYLAQNRLASLPIGLWGIENLLHLDLSGNQIRGELHSDIRKSNAIVTIDLSSNLFSGSIPDSLGELKALTLLNLSRNMLDGSIPNSFGNLLSLEDLDLSHNNLSGSIPASLEILSYLREVNFSYNQLQGQIPQDGIFLNSSRESFDGNRGLCGMPSLGFPRCHASRTGQWAPGSKNFMLSIMIPVVTSVTLVIVLLSIWVLKRRRAVQHEAAELVDVNGPKKIPYHQIIRGTNHFNETNLLGVGSTGSVFKAILPDDEVVAVKVLNLDVGNEGKKRFDAECEVLKQIRHRNLVQIITTCSNENLKAIILPYMPNGNLETWLHEHGHFLNFQQRIQVMLDVAMAVEYLHHGNDFPVVHCDLKPSNVLLDADMVAHVSDFGISKIVGRGRMSVQTKTLGTIGYIAPEYGSEGIVSTAGDVYSYGIMMMEVLTRRRPTDELFTSNLSMRQWVEEAYHNSLNEVLDIDLFQDQQNGFVQYHVFVQSLIELSLHCSNEAPQERINMKDVVTRLIKIKETLLSNTSRT